MGDNIAEYLKLILDVEDEMIFCVGLYSTIAV